jgi:hypothetical protein
VTRLQILYQWRTKPFGALALLIPKQRAETAVSG